MDKTILLGAGNGHSSSNGMKLYLAMGVLFTINGFLILRNAKGLLEIIISVLLVLSAIYYLVYGIMATSKKSKWAPRVVIKNEAIEVKANVFKPGIRIAWEQVKQISFTAYTIVFDLNGTTESISYETIPDISIAIKDAIREVSNRKGIEVVGG